MAAKVAVVMISSTGRGEYSPHAYGKYLSLSDGTTIRTRSSHMPRQTPHETITAVVIVRNRLIPSRIRGTTKFTVTISQKSGANLPVWVVQKTFISASWLPYQTVSRSLKTK